MQEFIAESWEKYHTEGGKGFSKAFQEVLAQITEAFKAVYNSISGKQISPELRQMFDEILGKELITPLLPKNKTIGKIVKVKNAPAGNHLNIGLYEGRTKKKMSSKGVLSKLPKDLKVISFSEIKGTEPTLVVETSRPLTDAEMIKFLGDTKQQAIPQLSNGEGILYDTERGTKDGWGEFNPGFFILQDGKSLSEYAKTEAPKLNESNVENAIELLDEIKDNKRKAERASSKTKANLEQKITEAETELDKISEEAKIVKVINDNFDKIKKDLKEQGLLNVKC